VDDWDALDDGSAGIDEVDGGDFAARDSGEAAAACPNRGDTASSAEEIYRSLTRALRLPLVL